MRVCEEVWRGLPIDATHCPHYLSVRTGPRHGFEAFYVRVNFSGNGAQISYFADMTGVTDGAEVARARGLNQVVECQTIAELRASLEALRADP